MDYKILPYSLDQAKKLGVTIKPSTKKDKKIDVFKSGKLIHSIGAKGYKDFPTYVKEKGLDYASERRELYKSRHKKDLSVVGSKGWYADKILW